VTLDRLWAGWRSHYLGAAGAPHPEAAAGPGACVFCRILASSEPPETTLVVWRDDTVAAVLNAYPYTSGHLLVLPVRHAPLLDDLTPGEGERLWATLRHAEGALRRGYQPEGTNVGANLGRAAGAGLPEHLHFHVLPRWSADTNFMTTVAEARVLPEALPATFARVRAAWAPTAGEVR